MLNIVLHQPEIPHNTGAAGRLALATNATLHLIKPLGFDIDDKSVKRAGLDYWKDVKVKLWENWEEFLSSVNDPERIFLLTTKSKQAHWDCSFQEGDYLVFGRETKGLPESLIKEHQQRALCIPMEQTSTRSLNLATAVGIVLYEAQRQIKTHP